jgi:flagellar basal-body rod protein FlgB
MTGMDTAEIPIFAMLRGRLSYLAERQKVIAENVANSNTAGFTPRDLKPFSFQVQQAASAGAMTVTQPGHMALPHTRRAGSGAAFRPTAAPDSETTLDGNAVVLEEEMLKMTDARMNYDAAIGFYQKSMSLLRLATRAPGRG